MIGGLSYGPPVPRRAGLVEESLPEPSPPFSLLMRESPGLQGAGYGREQMRGAGLIEGEQHEMRQQAPECRSDEQSQCRPRLQGWQWHKWYRRVPLAS